MKLARTIADAQTVLPNVRPASRNQSVSNNSAAAPERKKTSESGFARTKLTYMLFEKSNGESSLNGSFDSPPVPLTLSFDSISSRDMSDVD